MAILSKAIPDGKLHELFFFYFPMLFRAPSAPQWKPDTCLTFSFRSIIEKRENSGALRQRR
jgi:hypothetical protein